MTPVISGFLYPILFPKFNLWFLFPISLVPLILFSLNTGLKPKTVFLYATLSGTAAHIITLYWLYPVMVWNGVGYIPSILALFFLSVYLGLYWGIFSLIVNRYRFSSAKTLMLLIPALWVFLELVKTYLFTGFPWLLAGYSLWRAPFLLHIASFTGVYGLSFSVLFINTTISLSLQRKSFRSIIWGVFLFVIMGAWGLLSDPGEGEDTIKAAVLQGSISQYMKWDPSYEEYILSTYRNLHEKAAEDSPDIIIWPETSLPGALAYDTDLMDYIGELARESGAWQIVGSYERERGKFFNSAYSVTPRGEITESYRKVHLTPFGEYVPFRGIITPIVSVVGQFGDFFPGDELRPLPAAGTQLSVGICYESIFPHLARRGIKKGGEVFVNITNDGWFLQTAGPQQHFIHSVIRSVENRVWTVRAANTGISAIIDPSGRIVKKTSLMEKSTVSGEISPSKKKTFYTSFGDIFAYIIGVLLAVSIWRQEKCLKNIRQE